MKRGLIFIVTASFGFVISFLVWFFEFRPKVDVLKVVKEDSLISRIEKVDNWFKNLNKNNKFNGAVLLIKKDSVLLKKAYGYSDANSSRMLTTSSSFRLASLSKQFTATGIMLLKERGLLSFEDEIIKFLPELSYNKVTIRHLLNHTSGIPDVYIDFPKKYKKEVGDLLTNEKVVKLLAKMNPKLENSPNEKYQYSNIGYVLLSTIIERISKKSFQEFLQTELFDKLEMRNSKVWNLLSKSNSFANKTSSYYAFWIFKKTLNPGVLDGVSGDDAVFSSIDDLIIWNQFWYKNNLLSNSIIKEAFTRPKLNNGINSPYGFGWLIKDNIVWHKGSWLGARTLIVRDTLQKNTIVLLDNSSSACIDNIHKELAKIF